MYKDPIWPDLVIIGCVSLGAVVIGLLIATVI